MRLLLALLVGAALAGCVNLDSDNPLGSNEPGPEPFVWRDPLMIGDEHDHGDILSHNVSNNMTLVGNDPMGATGGVSEIDMAGDYAYVGVMGFGFIIMDISDPTNPEVVSRTAVTSADNLALGAYIADLKVDATGDWVFVALELSTTPGVLIYDATDKANPVLAGFWPEPGLLLGCHMIEYAEIAELEYLFCAPLDNAIYVGLLLPAVGGVREVVQVARWMPSSPEFAEEQLAKFLANPTGYPLSLVSGHQDMTFVEDPLDGTPMLYVSFWNLGVRFVDVSIPAAPVEVGSWTGQDAEFYRGLIHTTMPFESEGRRIVVSIPEVARPPALFVIDATDFANPVLLSEWKAQEDFQGQDTTFSLHNFQIVNGKVYLSMYHGGVWVLDLSTPELQTEPRVLGTYLPHEPRPDGNSYRMSIWDVTVWRGYVMTADNHGGFYVLHLDGDPRDEPSHSGFA